MNERIYDLYGTLSSNKNNNTKNSGPQNCEQHKQRYILNLIFATVADYFFCAYHVLVAGI
jgi:hypothetical protein